MDDGIHPGLGTSLRVYDLDSVLRCAAVCGTNSSHLNFCFFFPLSMMARVMKALISKPFPRAFPEAEPLPWHPLEALLLG